MYQGFTRRTWLKSLFGTLLAPFVGGSMVRAAAAASNSDIDPRRLVSTFAYSTTVWSGTPDAPILTVYMYDRHGRLIRTFDALSSGMTCKADGLKSHLYGLLQEDSPAYRISITKREILDSPLADR
jgi:hypothetical protein